MINPLAKLVPGLLEGKPEKKPTRDGFGNGTVEAGKENPNVVVLSADLGDSTRAAWFQKEFPDRYVEVGVAEQNLATVAAGMANEGKIPFIASYAAFSPGRNWEQIRTTIALNNMPVKVCGMHAGIQTGPDGATHQMLEDIALMRAMPNMMVMVPGDAEEGKKCAVAAARLNHPVYIRYGRASEPVFTTPETPFEIGKALNLWESKNPKVAIFTTGSIAYQALSAAKTLAEEGIDVVVTHFHTVKPIDREAIITAAKDIGKIITLEEHQTMGGFGSAVAEVVSEEYPAQVIRMGIQDEFGQSGEADELMEYYKLTAPHIVAKVKSVAGV
ncbi:MAG: transketolase C-terminal domain-containing protein [Patescibacteria group bacterium]